jgi:hypothetical protein
MRSNWFAMISRICSPKPCSGCSPARRSPLARRPTTASIMICAPKGRGRLPMTICRRSKPRCARSSLPTRRCVRQVWSREQLISRWQQQGESFKAEWAAELPGNEDLTVYWSGDDWLDMCRGPHLPSTGKLDPAGVQADAGVGRLLARRPEQRDAEPHLRHRLAEQEAARCASVPAGRSRQARSPQDRPRDGPVPLAGGSAWQRVLAPARLRHLSRARGLYAPPAGCRRLSRGENPADHGCASVGAVGPLGQISREHVRHPRRSAQCRRRWAGDLGQGAVDGAQADELPGACADLPPGHQVVPRPAAAAGRNGLLPQQRAAWRAARADAGAPVHPGRCAYLLPRGPDRRRSAASSASCSTGLSRPRLHRLCRQAGAAPGKALRQRRDVGQAEESNCARRC